MSDYSRTRQGVTRGIRGILILIYIAASETRVNRDAA